MATERTGGDDTLIGGDGDDTITGGDGGGDSIDGGSGDDTIIAGDDTIPDVGSGDTIFGGPGNDLVILEGGAVKVYGFGGIDSLVGGAGDDVIEANSTRVAHLDFDSATEPGEHVYTLAERDAIQTRMERDFAPFNVQITQSQPASGPFITVLVNEPLTIGGVESSGGASQRVGWRDLARGGSVIVDVNAFLGTNRNQLPPTEENFIALTSTIATHELAHMYGLRHHDSFGAPGTGVFAGLGGKAFLPDYRGPISAGETSNHLIASPASVRTSLVDALGNPFFGERQVLAYIC